MIRTTCSRISDQLRDMYSAGMLLHINGKFTMGKLKSSLLSYSLALNRSPISISRCMSMYDADLIVYVLSFISSLITQTRSTESPSLELFNEMTSSYIFYESYGELFECGKTFDPLLQVRTLNIDTQSNKAVTCCYHTNENTTN